MVLLLELTVAVYSAAISVKLLNWLHPVAAAYVAAVPHGTFTVALALTDKAIPIDHPKLQHCERLAIVMGTEGDGLTDEVIESCDDAVIIPMQNGVDSLNVAAAASVAFWQLR